MNSEMQLAEQLKALEKRVSDLERHEYLTPGTKPHAVAVYQSWPGHLPAITGAWYLNRHNRTNLTFPDASGLGKSMTLSGTWGAEQINTITRALVFNGTNTLLTRSGDTDLEFNANFGVMGWQRKQTSGTQFVIAARSQSLAASTANSWYWIHGSGDAINLTVFDGTTSYTHNPFTAPINEWYFAAGVYTRSSQTMAVYLGTRDGWQADDTGVGPADINVAAGRAFTIGGVDGGSVVSEGAISVVSLNHSSSNEELFRYYFEHTKVLFFN